MFVLLFVFMDGVQAVLSAFVFGISHELGKRAMASVCPKVAPLSISYHPIDFGSSSAMPYHRTQYSTILVCLFFGYPVRLSTALA